MHANSIHKNCSKLFLSERFFFILKIPQLESHVFRQPRPQGFSLKKWVGPTHFLREEPWGRGWFSVCCKRDA